jgi:hypothetical protein
MARVSWIGLTAANTKVRGNIFQLETTFFISCTIIATSRFYDVAFAIASMYIFDARGRHKEHYRGRHKEHGRHKESFTVVLISSVHGIQNA